MSRVLTAATIQRFNRLVVAPNACTVVKPNELDSALHRPANTAYYKPGSTPGALAASLAYGIIMNHPFQDGNKRTAFWAANEYLREHNHQVFTSSEPGEFPAESVMCLLGQAHQAVAANNIGETELADIYDKVLRDLSK